MPVTHGTGWLAPRAAAARRELLATRRYATVAPGARAKPDVWVTPRLRWLFQGSAGTCWAHAPVAMAENLAVARGYPAYRISRRLVAWSGSYEFGQRGNPSDGGSGLDALTAMAKTGVAHEDLCPYTDDASVLGQKPAQKVFADATATHLTVPVPILSRDRETLKEQIRVLNAADHGVCIGIPWCPEWDAPRTFQERLGRVDPNLGHELLIYGYARAGVIHEDAVWFVDNWHSDRGRQYPALPPPLAARVPRYHTWLPGWDSSTLFTDSLLNQILDAGDAPGGGGCEFVSASDLTGALADVLVPSADGLFPI